MSSFGGTATANGPSSTTEQAKEQAKEKAQQGAQQAKRSVRDQVDQRSTQAGERVGTTAQDIRSVSEELRKQGKDQPAKLAEQAATRAVAPVPFPSNRISAQGNRVVTLVAPTCTPTG